MVPTLFIRNYHRLFILLVLSWIVPSHYLLAAPKGLTINEQDYFEMPGLNVLVFHNTFSEGHQGDVEIIQHGDRVATNGNLRLSPAPGQWQPVPKIGEGFKKIGCSPQDVGNLSRVADRENNELRIKCSYPDDGRERKGFNPIIYPDLKLTYTVRVRAEGQSFTITVDLDEPLPKEWVGRVGYNLELFPGNLYGKSYIMDDKSGIFPRQANGPTYMNPENEAEAMPLAEGNHLVIAPESDLLRMTVKSTTNPLQLLDGSLKHNNGWFVMRSMIRAGATKNAVHWKITPHVIPNWKGEPVVHLSQIGYHPKQDKVAHIELDKRDTSIKRATLYKITSSGDRKKVLSGKPKKWGRYLRYNYLQFDFSSVKEPGIYQVRYREVTSNPFRIDANVYKRHVWQPTLEYFLPVQMCHMRVNQKYRVWHGACHLDDALMAPLHINHFDGYNNTKEISTLCSYKPLEHVPGLNVGGWHDAADYDLRIESQAATVNALALAYEEFSVSYDQTMIDQEHRHVEIHQPDGKPDILQQVEHGVLTILSGYRSLGFLYDGIIVPSLRQYVHLGDGSTQTDNRVWDDSAGRQKAALVDGLWYKKVANRYSSVFDPEMNLNEIEVTIPDLDDRLVFTETHPGHQIQGATSLIIASRVLKGYNDDLAAECLAAGEALWEKNKDSENENPMFEAQKIHALAELILATGKKEYKKQLVSMHESVEKHFAFTGWCLGRVMPLLDDKTFAEAVTKAAKAYKPKLDEELGQTPFGVPLEHTLSIAFRQYYLHKGWPKIYGPGPLFDAVNYLLGCRPGRTTNSLVSGVGVSSPTVAYSFNRADWSYTPGGTFWNAVNLVHPDFPEDKVWPYLWQEREYIITTPCYYMFSVLAVDDLLNE